MPMIPNYQQQTQAGGALNVQTNPGDFGGQTAQAAQRLSGALGEDAHAGLIGQRVQASLLHHDQQVQASLLHQQDERTARSWVGAAVVQSTLDMDTNLQNQFAKQLPGGPDLFPQVMKDFEDYRTKAMANAPSDMARDYYGAHLNAIGESIGKRTLAFDGANRVSGYINNTTTAITNGAKLVQQNPEQYGNMLSVIRQTMPDVGPENRQRLDGQATAAMTNAAASHWLDVDPYKVKDATSKAMGEPGKDGTPAARGTTGVQWVDDATPEQVATWNSQASAKIFTIERAAQITSEAQSLRTDAQSALEVATKIDKPTTGFDRMVKITAQSESGGRETNPDGSTVTSPKGALGIMQVMPATAANPGFGVTPAKDSSPAERARVGQDYLRAMLTRYDGDQQKAWAAYNAGPGAVDKAMSNAASSRAGTRTSWLAYLPKETQAYVGKNIASYGAPDPAVAPMTTAQYEAQEGAVMTQARTIAEKSKPGDAVYADKVATETHALWARNLQILRSDDYGNFTSVLGATMKSGATSIGDLPTNVQATIAKLSPQNMQGIQAQFERNARAANGEYTASDPKLVNDLTQRLYLPDGDPKKITNPGQLTEYMGKGLNYTDQQRLMKQITEANSPEGSPFLKQAAMVKDTGRKMLVGSLAAMNPVAMAHPDIADEAAYRFSIDVDNKIAAMRAAKQDPHSLFVPGSKDYVLDPNRVASFMPTEGQIAARKAQAPAVAPVAAPGIPRVSSDADFNALPAGALFMAPDGSRRRKPGGPS